MKLLPFIAMLGFCVVVPASAAPLTDPALEARAVHLGREIRCTVCQSESIEDSAADMARDMRALVRDKIAAGWTDEQIRTFLQSRYGDFILLKPPIQANTLALWLAPGFIFALSGLGLWLAFRRRGRKGV